MCFLSAELGKVRNRVLLALPRFGWGQSPAAKKRKSWLFRSNSPPFSAFTIFIFLFCRLYLFEPKARILRGLQIERLDDFFLFFS